MSVCCVVFSIILLRVTYIYSFFWTVYVFTLALRMQESPLQIDSGWLVLDRSHGPCDDLQMTAFHSVGYRSLKACARSHFTTSTRPRQILRSASNMNGHTYTKQSQGLQLHAWNTIQSGRITNLSCAFIPQPEIFFQPLTMFKPRRNFSRFKSQSLQFS